ncbi:hypothetical protein C6988_00665 [Nitrosopumilus sp. b1]|uniref:hypothetical protein n=1 Tax=Nitrosopumilus sp. b1 TaxID=2109907 RepID=UPI0015F4B48F|nr:hypothetical protein [Nitrosopumilus sp. b1]KAF6243959.1 hypothetical protein C6988_00665 [Nitrosopumilus sp. b1]
MQKTLVLSSILIAFLILPLSSVSFAHPHPGMIGVNGHTHTPQTEIFPIDATMGVEKSTVFFHAPTDNVLPWAFVEGKIANHVKDYPVIIQMYQNGEPARFAQAEVNEDGTYEYKFRVRSVDDGQVTRSFTGDYTVVIYKVVYLHPNLDTA